MITADYHTHTSFSTDSKASMESMIETAIKKGLTKYCITDHMDKDYPLPPDTKEWSEQKLFELNLSDYIKKIENCRSIYGSKIQLLTGIELGLRNELEQKETIRAYYDMLLSEYEFDFVIGSTHVLNNIDPYYKEFWEQTNTKCALNDYFKSIIENSNYYHGFQVYGHLDYLIRYILESPKDYSVSDYLDIIDVMLQSLITNGIGIECNTSGFKYGLERPHPKFELLKRYHELGGEIITVGSDAHKPEFIAYEFDRAAELLKLAGFRYYTVFKQKIPYFERL